MQSLRFVIVGLTSNLVLYLLYLTLTTFGFGHKTAMTLLYLVGTLQTFIFNQRWTFEHRGVSQSAFVKYIAAYGLGYLFNLFALLLLVDLLRVPHEIVQGILILVLAVLLFLLQKFWVFRPPRLA
ncbi:MAG TPA: GtrA family protein [Candidatus Competibacter sp.]|nr:GtrA family protein [Candidatus Competibacteraceae bacterium]HPE72087.1 GtrA family protein [Candidatus Competibacter sp.]